MDRRQGGDDGGGDNGGGDNAAPTPEQDYMAELEQLNKLKEQGILTDDEFEAKKKKILGI
jgi:hypothetical protein